MTTGLFVFRDQDQVGHVMLDDNRRWLFVYNPQWVIRPDAFQISMQLPLQDAVFGPDHAKPFFANLLPEGAVRNLITKKLQVSEGNDFELLKRLGGECAGALSLYPTPQSAQGNGDYRAISFDEFDQLLDNVSQRPLLLVDKNARLSLAGAQEKVPVYIKETDLFFPENGAASTHILKPAMQHFEGSVQNEAFCMGLARGLGLLVPDNEIRSGNQGRSAFLIKRYDRQMNRDGSVTRLHQEDFCQALGMMPDQKYQNEGGPAFLDCFKIIDHYATQPALDKKRLIEWAVFNFLIGNCDAHAKNISLLISANAIQLAPFYDLMSTVVYEGLSEKMAMKIGGYYERDVIVARHWVKFADDIGVKPTIVLQTLKEFSKKLSELAQREGEEIIAQHGGAKTISQIISIIETTAKRFI